MRVLNAGLGNELVHREFPVVDEFGPQIEALSQTTRGGPIPPSSGTDGCVDMAIIEAIYGAAQAGIPQAVKLRCNGET